MSQNLPIRTGQTSIAIEERSPKNRMLTFTLACLGGWLGLHRFYTGRFWTGLLMLLTSGGFAIWWILDVLLLLSGRFKDGEGRVLGPPHTVQRPVGRLPHHEPPRTHQARPGAKQLQTNTELDEDLDLDALIEDPLEEKFRQLEREQKGVDGQI